jgi:excisionase family DNA binding protein
MRADSRRSAQGAGEGAREVSPSASPVLLPAVTSGNRVKGGGGSTSSRSRKSADSRERRRKPPTPSPPAGVGAGAGPPRRLASLATAAAYADVSTRTLRRYISKGRLTGYRVGPRLVKVDLNELEALARPIPTARAPRP